VLELITDRRHLGVHTEMLTDGMVNLYHSRDQDRVQLRRRVASAV
jgi:hypothetical protein